MNLLGAAKVLEIEAHQQGTTDEDGSWFYRDQCEKIIRKNFLLSYFVSFDIEWSGLRVFCLNLIVFDPWNFKNVSKNFGNHFVI